MDISNQELKGAIRLKGFNNLEELNCSENELTNLYLNDCPKLRKLDCSSNNLNSNNFSESNLSSFKNFTKLEELKLGNDNKEKINQGIYNRFSGSLKPLKNLTKLKVLHIDNTDLNSGAEHLPASLIGIDNGKKEKISYFTEQRPESKEKAKEIADTAIVDAKEKFEEIKEKVGTAIVDAKKIAEEITEETTRLTKNAAEFVSDLRKEISFSETKRFFNFLKEIKKEDTKEFLKRQLKMNEIQTKPEAYLYLSHLLSPLHGEKTYIEIKASKSEKEEAKIKSIGLTTEEKLFIDERKIIHGIKGESNNSTSKFFKLKTKYENEKELSEDASKIILETLLEKRVIEELKEKSAELSISRGFIVKQFEDEVLEKEVESPKEEKKSGKLVEQIEKESHSNQESISFGGQGEKFFKNIKHYGRSSAELYMMYAWTLENELPNYIKKVKEEMGSGFINFNRKFEELNKKKSEKKNKELKNKIKNLEEQLENLKNEEKKEEKEMLEKEIESHKLQIELNERVKGFGDFVVKKLLEQVGSLDNPEKIEVVKEKVQRKTLNIAPAMPLGLGLHNEKLEETTEGISYKNKRMAYEKEGFSLDSN
ncbi:35278_t:CDS:2 [Racocetra persica]|uniref:35278_t:CDS:1 n=1 Tax=Racocetra persica TaxID=160502 RepID=A0ACA9PMS6_9GLOM|nr:35278_t:CDS:2 [Racocetra persica]